MVVIRRIPGAIFIGTPNLYLEPQHSGACTGLAHEGPSLDLQQFIWSPNRSLSLDS